MPRILLVDDDPSLREVVRYALDRAGHEVHEAADGVQALAAFSAKMPDLIVLDVMMPELDGLEVCRRIRATSRVPILFLSSRGEEVDRILGLELGGDDYMTKPFSPRELVTRVKVLLRRTAPAEAPVEAAVQVGMVRLDTEQWRAWVGPDEIELTVTEFRLLEVLCRRPGRVFPRSELVSLAYPGTHYISDRTVDSHIRRIRAKLRGAGVDDIETVHGLGFRLKAQ
jgi:two-component system OmpR family response regulator